MTYLIEIYPDGRPYLSLANARRARRLAKVAAAMYHAGHPPCPFQSDHWRPVWYTIVLMALGR